MRVPLRSPTIAAQSLRFDITSPNGYRAPSGRFADAEYVMTGATIPLRASVRDAHRALTMLLKIEVFDGKRWTMLDTRDATVILKKDSATEVAFGTFTPRTLAWWRLSDRFYGAHPNVTPLYRFTLANDVSRDTLRKSVRFYIQRSHRSALVAVKRFQMKGPKSDVDISNKLNTDSLLSAFDQINWRRTQDTAGGDYDLFERDKWPTEHLDFTPWNLVFWEQGSEPQGLEPGERGALKTFLDNNSPYRPRGLVIAGQDIARIHAVDPSDSTQRVADRPFLRNYLGAEYRGTLPAVTDSLVIRGVRLTPGRQEMIVPTGFVGDRPPTPSLLRLARRTSWFPATHSYQIATANTGDTLAGAIAGEDTHWAIYFGVDWRHVAQMSAESDISGIKRLVLGAVDFCYPIRIILPIVIDRFDAYQSGREAVTIEWKSVAEVGIAKMEIERTELTRTAEGIVESMPGVIDGVFPLGGTTTGAKYRVLDAGVKVGGEYRYRLVLVDIDGHRVVEESKVVKVFGADVGAYSLEVLPNPMRDSGFANYCTPAGEKIRITVYDVRGSVVTSVEVEGGEGRVELAVSSMTSGTYTILFESSSGVQLVKKVTVEK